MRPLGLTIGRRDLGAAAWFGGLALAVSAPPARSSPVPRPAEPPPPLVIGVWTRVAHRTLEAEVKLVRLNPDGRPADVISASEIPAREVTSFAAVPRLAREVARAHVARLWGVPADRCRIKGAMIHEEAGARCARLLEWTDLA